MRIKVDFITIYKSFLNLQNSENDLDVLEDMSNSLAALEELAETSEFSRYGLVVDDTTLVYMTHLLGTAKKVVDLFTPLCDDFLGISKEKRTEALKLLPDFLVSYGIILYKRFGYEIIAEYYAVNNSVDVSKVTLPAELLEDVTSDLTHVIDTLRTILVVFKQFGAYFAEYQIGDSEDLNDVINELENRGYGTEAISTLSQEEVQAILNGNG